MQQRTVFLAVAFTLLAWTIVMCVLEPVVLDGWFLVDWHANGGGFGEYVRSNWMGEQVWSNPRLGQWAMFATYEGLAWHLVITPSPWSTFCSIEANGNCPSRCHW